MKPNYTLRMPAYQYTAGGGPRFGEGVLVARTWAGVLPRERDRDFLPVLHTRGFVNAALGVSPDTDPSPGLFPGAPQWVESPTYWGKQGTPLAPPRALMVGDLTTYIHLCQSATDGAALDAAGVLRFYGDELSPSQNLLVNALPWTTPVHTGDLGNGDVGDLPTVDAATFTGGDSLIVVDSGSAYSSDGNFNTGMVYTKQLASDISQAVAASAKFHRLRYVIYSGGEPEAPAFYDFIAAQARAAGVDVVNHGTTPTLESVRADYKGFFGI